MNPQKAIVESTSNSTPMIRQYLTIKKEHPDMLLFYRMGDFYEMFFEDATIASKILEITLTSRNKKEKSPIPMCGVPFRAVDGYIAQLIEHGYKVAICDQIEDSPKSRNVSAKALVKREVVRIITPGMIVDNNFLNEKSNNYILAIFQNKNTSGLSYLDISTGTFRVSESEDINLIIDETLRVSPSEILFPESFKTDPFFSLFLKAVPEKTVTFLDNTAFDYNRGKDRLAEQLKPISLQVFGCKDLKAGISAAGAILFYVGETQKQKIEHLSKIEPYTLNNYLLIDNLSCRNLELLRNLQTGSRQGSLLGTIDKTITAMGGRLLKRWLRYPLLDIEQIHARLDAVDDAKEKIDIRSRIRQSLKSVSDLERLNSRIAMGHSNARDLIALKSSLYVLPEIRSALSRLKAALFTWNENTVSLNELAELIEKAIREDPPPTISEGNIIKEGYNKKLDELISISRDGKNWLVKFEAKEKEKTGINTLKVRYNKVFGYYIEVSKAQSKNVPPNYIRKQTLVNAERYITDELKNFEKNVLTAEDEKAILEYKIFNNIRKEVVKNNNLIKNVAEFLAELDCLLNLAEIADLNNYKRPEINASGRIFIEDGRHPVVEKMITGERFVPNTIKMDNTKNQILIITGPNMAGKSTVLRQVAILVLMAQMGSFVPARRALISITDKIFTRVGALDNLSQGESTFMVEMKETANILNNSTAQSLVVMDEIGRGTSTFDGISIAWAVAECLHDLNDRGVKTLFATHYYELTNLEKIKPRIKNFNIAVKEWNNRIIFLRKLIKGSTNRSYGIQVAQLAGIPEKVIIRAKRILSGIEGKNLNLKSLPSYDENDVKSKQKQLQLNLSGKRELSIIDQLNKLDISTTTPLEALNYLNKLKEMID